MQTAKEISFFFLFPGTREQFFAVALGSAPCGRPHTRSSSPPPHFGLPAASCVSLLVFVRAGEGVSGHLTPRAKLMRSEKIARNCDTKIHKNKQRSMEMICISSLCAHTHTKKRELH
jgi:hypothetical protein